MSKDDEKLYTSKEVIAKLKTSESTLYRWLRKGEIEASYAGRQLRFSEKELKRFLDLKRRARDRQQPRTKRAYTRKV